MSTENNFNGTASHVTQTGPIYGDAHFHADGSPVRSAYLQQVRRIAPDDLVHRDRELAELTDWCVEPEQEVDYLWWRAPAWFGKSALLSWFVLHPPAGVRVVSFFITAALSNQSDKAAFADVLLEQLAELIDEPLPTTLTDATRDTHLRHWLDRAALACEQRGQRLILVVDGLDEDRGVVAGPNSYSIAALLPEQPVGGLRVVVSGRPDPPIPADVPDDHPLREPRIVRELTRSGQAEVVRKDAVRELQHLFHGTPAERDLLGLVATGGGGLSAPDLAGLTGLSQWEITELLHAASGRTFSQRAAEWGLRSDPPVYLLAHEQLQQEAVSMLGAARLAGYRQQLHEWADEYRRRGWPPETPEYLLRGYFRVLVDVGDTTRLVACALDEARHDRMLDLATVMAEVTTAQQLLTSESEPDLATLLRLAIHRDELAKRDEQMPPELPAAWVRLGHHSYAQILVASMNKADKDRALAALADVVAAAGDVDEAKALVQSIAGRREGVTAVTSLLHRMVEAGDLAGAETYACSRPIPNCHAEVLAALVKAMADAGSYAHDGAIIKVVKALTRAMAEPSRREVVTVLVAAASRAGDMDHAERLVRLLDDPRDQVRALVEYVKSLAARDDTARAVPIAARIETLARSITRSDERATALALLAQAVAVAGDPDRASEISTEVEAMGSTGWDVSHALVGAAIAAGDPARVAAVARSARNQDDQAYLLFTVVQSLAGSGDTTRAEALAWSIASSYQRSRALAILARVVAEAGDTVRAVALATDAEAVARSSSRSRARSLGLFTLARAVAGLGDTTRAGALADRMPEDMRARLQTRAGRSTTASDRTPEPVARFNAAVAADDLAGAEALISSMDDPDDRDAAWSTLIGSAAMTGDVDRAVGLTRYIAEPVGRSVALSNAVELLASAGHIVSAQTLASHIAFPYVRARASLALVKAMTVADDVASAEALARSITEFSPRVSALTLVAQHSEPPRARRILADTLLHRGSWTTLLPAVPPEIVIAIADDYLRST